MYFYSERDFIRKSATKQVRVVRASGKPSNKTHGLLIHIPFMFCFISCLRSTKYLKGLWAWLVIAAWLWCSGLRYRRQHGWIECTCTEEKILFDYMYKCLHLNLPAGQRFPLCRLVGSPASCTVGARQYFLILGWQWFWRADINTGD